MKPEKVFKRYDIRGEYPEEIDEEFAELLGKALATFAVRNFDARLVVCRDNKESSEQLKQSLIEGATSAGADVIDVGEGPTDYAAWCGKHENAVSVEVTSSHMPVDFNGFKFMYPEGNGFVNEDLYTVQDIFRDRDFEEGDGSVVEKEMIEKYRESMKEFARGKGEDWRKKVVVDSLGGTGKLLPELLEELGAEVIEIERNEIVDPPNPKPDKLERLGQKVEETEAELGIANDLDSDRVTVYLKDRGFLSGNEIFAVLAQLSEPPFVASVDTSSILDEYGEVQHTRVGDPFVMDRAVDIDAELAGEPNGHYSFLRFVPYNSGMLAAVILSGLDLEERLDSLPESHEDRKSIEVEDNQEKEDKMKRLKKEVSSRFEVITEIDGVKYRDSGATVLIRPSGSSPKIRAIAEADSEEKLEKALDEAENLIRNA